MNLRDCRSIQTIVPDWVAGRLPDAMTSGLRRHLDRCPDCRVVVAEWRRVAGALEAARPTVAPPPPAVALAKVDRFRHSQPAGPVAPRPVAPRPVARWVMAMGLLLLAGIAVWRLRPGDAPDKASRSNAGQDSDPRLSAVIGRSSDSADPAALPPATQPPMEQRHLPAQRPDGGDLPADAVARVADSRTAAAVAGDGGFSGSRRSGAPTIALRAAGAPQAATAQTPPAPDPTLTVNDEPRETSEATAGGGPEPVLTVPTGSPTATATASASPSASPPVPEPPTDFALVGVVVDDMDRPIPGAYLQLWSEPTGQEGPLAYLTESDSEGRFSLLLPAGGYFLHGEAAGHEAAWWGGADRAAAQRLGLPADPAGPQPRLVLRRLLPTVQPTVAPTGTATSPPTVVAPTVARQLVDR